MKNSNDWPSELRSALDAYFSEEDLEALCFDSRIDYQALPGGSKPKKVVELIALMSRKGRVVELIDRCRHYRPNVPWDELREAASDDPLVFNSISRLLSISSEEKPRPTEARQRLSLWIPIVVIVTCGAIAILLFFQVEEQPAVAVEPTSMLLDESEATITPTLTDLSPSATVTLPPAGDSIATTTSTPTSASPTETVTALPPEPAAATETATATQTPTITPSHTPTSVMDGSSLAIYIEQPSFAGNCAARPPGSICLGYSDDFVWLIYDSIHAWDTAGTFQGNEVAVARGGSADYYHVLNSNLVKGVPTDLSRAGYIEQPSFTGDCLARPPGSVCLAYSDDFVWLIYDSIQARHTAGAFQGNEVAVARGGSAEYYHVLNTNLVKAMP